MKKRIFIICMIFLSLILFFISYKFFIVGNNKSIENISEIDDFILSIGNYEIEANVTIYSNKNSNTYSLKQKKQDDYQKQEIVDNEGNGLVIENSKNRVVIKNTKLSLEEVFDNYEDIAKDIVGFDAFVADYKNLPDERKISEDEKYYIVFVKNKSGKNKYNYGKTLFINKQSGIPEKIEVTDVNNNRTAIIEYSRFQIL